MHRYKLVFFWFQMSLDTRKCNIGVEGAGGLEEDVEGEDKQVGLYFCATPSGQSYTMKVT